MHKGGMVRNNLARIERDILGAVYDKGEIAFLNGSHSPASQFLSAKCSSEQELQAVTITIQYLLEERYLFPFFDGRTREELRAYARGITPKGIDRLRQLRHPALYWMQKNWFPLVVAVTSVAIGTTNVVVNL